MVNSKKPTALFQVHEETAEDQTDKELAKIGQFKGRKTKAAAKSGGMSQGDILRAMDIAEEEIPKFQDPYFWLEYFPPLAGLDLRRRDGGRCRWVRVGAKCAKYAKSPNYATHAKQAKTSKTRKIGNRQHTQNTHNAQTAQTEQNEQSEQNKQSAQNAQNIKQS